MAYDIGPTRRPSTLRRVDVLAGCTVQGRDLALARIALNGAIALHRKAQERASKPWTSRFDRKPAKTRQDVLRAVSRVRDVEGLVLRKWGSV